MIEIGLLLDQVLRSPWLLVLLTLAVMADGPFPFLPSEPILFSAASEAAGIGDNARIAALFGAALAGSLLGDALLYGTGRTSLRIVRPTHGDESTAAWVRRHLHRRPILTLAAVRLIPGGRLVSVTAAGRVGLPPQRFVPATVASSLLWSTYMTGVGVLLGPITGGNPVLSLLAGIVSATIIGSGVECARRLIRRGRARRRRTTTPDVRASGSGAAATGRSRTEWR